MSANERLQIFRKILGDDVILQEIANYLEEEILNDLLDIMANIYNSN